MVKWHKVKMHINERFVAIGGLIHYIFRLILVEKCQLYSISASPVCDNDEAF